LLAQTALQAPQPPPIETVLTALINDLAGLAQPLILVLDDYHLVTSPAIHQSLDYLIEHLPPSLRLVIATRDDPPLALARLRARSQLSEIRAGDLRFSLAEAGAFLNDSRALALAPADVAQLTERAEGWIAGLRLAALSLQQSADRHAFIAAFSASHRFVADYLMDEVLARLDPPVQQFLRRTSILRQLCAPLCDAVAGIENGELRIEKEAGTSLFSIHNSQFFLAELDRANLFLVPLDHERHWYRYHHLFAEFLRMHLRATEPELVPTLYQRAIDWCRAQGLPREALGYALDAHAYDQAAELIEALTAEVLSQEGPDPILGWIAALPQTLVQQRPLLGCAYAWALIIAGRMAEADTYLTAAEAASGGLDAATQQATQAQVAAHRAYLRFFQGAFGEAQALARQSLGLLPPGDLLLRARTALLLSTILRIAGQLRAAEETLIPLTEAIQTTNNVNTATLYYYNLGQLQREQGRLRQAQATFRQALAVAERQTGRDDSPFTGFAYVALGRMLWDWNDLEVAVGSILKGLAICRQWQQVDALAIGLTGLIELYLDRGEDALVADAIDELRQIVARMSSAWGSQIVATYQARFDLARGNLAAANRWAQASGLTVQGPAALDRIDEYLTLAQILVARGDLADAQRLLDQLARQLRATGSVERLLPTLILQVRALAGQEAAALVLLAEALDLGEPEGYIRTFVAGGPVVAALLKRMQDEGGRMMPYIARVLAAFPDRSPPPAESDLHPSSLILHPLNDRELSILRLMAAGMTNPEIGDQLCLSANTIRWYASQIFVKLDVSSRRAAVARARELGII
jgi:LuxR family transcriptional regulator, maltose regulon positive regulatory protein